MGKDSLELLIEKAVQEYSGEIELLKDIPITPMEQMMDRVEQSLKSKTGGPGKHRNNFKTVRRGLLAACVILLASVVVAIPLQSKQVNAFKFSIVKTFVEIKNSFTRILYTDKEKQLPDINNKNNDEIMETLTLEAAKQKIDFLTVPGYLPEGYKSKDVEWRHYVDGTSVVKQIYTDGKSDVILNQISNIKSVNMAGVTPGDNKVEKVEVMGVEGTMVSNGLNFYLVNWFKENQQYEIIAHIPKDEIIKVLKSLK